MTPALILFGAFDRHNFGDLLFPHLAASRHPERDIRYCGLVARDLTAFGGHRVEALDAVLAQLAPAPCEIVHVGGELLDCDAYSAAVMLEAPAEARAAIAAWDGDADGRPRWAARRLGTPRRVPYVIDKAALPNCTALRFEAVGGVGLADMAEAARAEVLAALAHADAVTVRDRVTLAALAAAGIAARLAPDPVEALGRHARAPAIRARAQELRAALGAYLAVQFSADFGDDATLDALADGLRRLAPDGDILVFRAGGAPWHDALEACERLQARLGARCHVFSSLDIWEICALIAGAQAYLGSSLHGRIVARAFAVPATSLERAPGAARKLRAWCATWDPGARIVTAQGLGQ